MSSSSGNLKTIWIRISIVLMIAGTSSTIGALFYDSTILASFGLSLVFWGLVSLLILPAGHTATKLLYATSISTYSTIDRLISDLKIQGSAYYLPYMPRATGSENTTPGYPIVLLSYQKSSDLQLLKNIQGSQFNVETPTGFIVTPPGLGLLSEIEKRIDLEHEDSSLEEVCKWVARFFTKVLKIAESISIELEENTATLKIVASSFGDLYKPENNSPSVFLIGCPITSAIACLIAKATWKPVTIKQQKSSEDGFTQELCLHILDGAE